MIKQFPLMGHYQVPPLQARMNMEVMEIKSCSKLSKAPGLEPQYQII